MIVDVGAMSLSTTFFLVDINSKLLFNTSWLLGNTGGANNVSHTYIKGLLRNFLIGDDIWNYYFIQKSSLSYQLKFFWVTCMSVDFPHGGSIPCSTADYMYDIIYDEMVATKVAKKLPKPIYCDYEGNEVENVEDAFCKTRKIDTVCRWDRV